MHHQQGALSIQMQHMLLSEDDFDASTQTGDPQDTQQDKEHKGLASEAVKKTIGKTLIKSVASSPDNLAAILPVSTLSSLSGVLLGGQDTLTPSDASDFVLTTMLFAGAQVCVLDFPFATAQYTMWLHACFRSLLFIHFHKV
jgi:hypothetical protein